MSTATPVGRASSGRTPQVGFGRWGLLWIAVWTFFLLEPLEAGWERRDTVGGWVGIAATVVFGAWYVAVFAHQRVRNRRPPASLTPWQPLAAIALAAVLAVVVCLAVGQHGTATAVYVCVLCIMTLRPPLSVVLTALVTATTYGAGLLVPGWTRDNTLLLSMLTASAAVFGITQMIRSNIALREANEENQRLAVSEERNRFARDLHDILGHSLTVITVKAELAGRLLELDPGRARAEVADLERLSRDALADVRRAVDGYRELTLPGELSRARIALRAAEIEADLPGSTDEVPGELRELFAWTVREGVTNVVRHSGATRCTVRLTARTAEVADDGRGCDGTRVGSGLVGLRERASALQATVVTTSGTPSGFTLRVVAP
ncbi:sensor histidine kinase [Angustibacter speluncae]